MFRAHCALACMPSDDLACRDHLAGMTLGMFGRVEDQPQDIAGELGTANRTGREELFLRKLFQVIHRVV